MMMMRRLGAVVAKIRHVCLDMDEWIVFGLARTIQIWRGSQKIMGDSVLETPLIHIAHESFLAMAS
jgi:hypothetical protein